MRHLVLGANGFIGQHVAARLIELQQEVVIATRAEPCAPISGVDGLSTVRFDLSQSSFDHLVAGFDVIHHHAWAHLPSTAALDPIGDLQTNLIGTVHLLEAMRRHGGQRLVFPSSGGTVYGEGCGRPAVESDPTVPLSAYGVSKLSAEHYIRILAAHGQIDARILRIANPYGERQNVKRSFGAIAHFAQRIAQGIPVQIWGDGEAVRDFVHIDDVAEVLTKVAVQPLDMIVSVYNLGSGQGTSLNQLISTMEDLCGRRADVTYQPARLFDVEYNVLDSSLLNMTYNWRPKVDLRAGLRRVVDQLQVKENEHLRASLGQGCPFSGGGDTSR